LPGGTPNSSRGSRQVEGHKAVVSIMRRFCYRQNNPIPVSMCRHPPHSLES
jgi:hypothetical protein